MGGKSSDSGQDFGIHTYNGGNFGFVGEIIGRSGERREEGGVYTN
jgi:hypothetical protein